MKLRRKSAEAESQPTPRVRRPSLTWEDGDKVFGASAFAREKAAAPTELPARVDEPEADRRTA